MLYKEKGGDQTEHKEYIRIVKDSDTAVLFIHGIVSTPNYFADLVPLVPENYSVYNVLLDGHGKGDKDFSKTSYWLDTKIFRIVCQNPSDS